MGGGIGKLIIFYILFVGPALDFGFLKKKVSMGGRELEIINLFLFFVGPALDLNSWIKKVST